MKFKLTVTLFNKNAKNLNMKNNEEIKDLRIKIEQERQRRNDETLTKEDRVNANLRFRRLLKMLQGLIKIFVLLAVLGACSKPENVKPLYGTNDSLVWEYYNELKETGGLDTAFVVEVNGEFFVLVKGEGIISVKHKY